MKRFESDRTEYQDRPFPYLIVDDALDESLFAKIQTHWPDASAFHSELRAGARILPLMRDQSTRVMSVEQTAFWNAFVDTTAREIIREAMIWFSRPLFEDMTSGDGGMAITMVDLVQVSGRLDALPAHTHYHDPTLLGTCIIYVDDAGDMSRGTNILAPKPEFHAQETLTTLALDISDERPLDEYLETARHVAFKPNRALILMDGPMSWHDASSSPEQAGSRRQIIINWALEERFMERRHGVKLWKYREERALNPRAPRVRAWVKSDIESQLGERRLTLTAARTLYESVSISVGRSKPEL